MRIVTLAVSIGLCSLPSLARAQDQGEVRELHASPTTVHRGFFDASLRPVLTVDSGDIVRLETASGNPPIFRAAGRAEGAHPEGALSPLRGRFITMGLHSDLDEAVKIATREMLDFLVATKNMSRDDAYMLASAADLVVTQVVDGTKGIHAMMLKAIFQR